SPVCAVLSETPPVKQSKFTIKGSIPNPPLYAAELLCDALTKANISVGKPPRALDEQEQRPPLKTIYTTWSPPLKRICDATNLWSLNLYADHLAIQCAVNQNKTATEAGVVLQDFWKTKGMNTRGLKIVDGSGLSVFNTVNAGHLVYLLHYMKKKSALAEVFETTLPVAGKSGTLSRYCVYGSGKDRIKAKGGSMTGVRSMAGYANTKSNKQIIFAVIINNYDESNGEIRKTLEDLLNMIAEM
ncbi:MAG TPA: D-alanyl-D-alanine carboxypeptidase, partial [Bacteroidales bacterium]|nr:D-alanyl-D-alanine carboxypeptidase [Bacteroidales bacterium]